ncbi:MAG: GH92 family glycosyl hydrolase [Verrucomicrobiales bacterium]|nr:GH92 family glycosyl hydrolase [Verrucomicrobiales bacterium]
MRIGSRIWQAVVASTLSLAAAEAAESARTPREWVDPRIGTAHCRWFFPTPAAVPFGMAKPAAATDAHLGNKSGWEAVGYDVRHDSIESFVQFHEFQIGGIALMPTSGRLQTVPGPLDQPDAGYRSRFRRADEVAEPGYYRVDLEDGGIRAELTATPRVGFHRFTYPAGSTPHLIFDVGNRQGESGPVLDAYVKRSGPREVEGFVVTHPEYARRYQPGAVIKMYFVARVNREVSGCGTFRGESTFPGDTALQGPGCGLYLDFDGRDGCVVEVQVGLSYTGIERARRNLEAEASTLTFDRARERARERWDAMLGRIQVEGGRDADRIKFYTGLYHALLGRGLASDVDGAYPKNDGGVGRIPPNADGTLPYQHYNTDAIWGAFWNLTQLWALAYPDYLSEFVRCQLDLYRDCGWLPDGIAAGKFVSGVGTDFMGLVVASAYLRGIRDFDSAVAYAAVAKNELGWQNRPEGVGKADTRAFLEHGYVPQIRSSEGYSGSTAEGSQFSASHTLEYSFSAFAAAQFAEALGKDAERVRFMELSKGWQHLFDAETGFIRPKEASGRFVSEFHPRKAWQGFQEGNAYQYTFYVPHDPAGLIARLGADTFIARLQEIFEKAEKAKFGGGETVDAFAGVESLYNHGNQPGLHMAWLFNFGSRPWLTQRWVRRICDVFYGTEPVHGYGYGQDEDQGQLGAWLVLAGMGLFDVQGGAARQSTLQLAMPLFDRVRVTLDRRYFPGQTLEIRVEGDASRSPYIQSASWNGAPWNRCWIPWEDAVRGGVLSLKAGGQPSETWGIEALPPSGGAAPAR